MLCVLSSLSLAPVVRDGALAGVVEWQTRSTQNALPRGVRVRIPLPALTIRDSSRRGLTERPARSGFGRLSVVTDKSEPAKKKAPAGARKRATKKAVAATPPDTAPDVVTSAPDAAAAPAAAPVPAPATAPVAEAVPEPQFTPPQPFDTGDGLRILVAEDEALIRVDLAEMLVESGYRVVGQASNGEQAVELAKELKPDVVIMDIKMPVLDGISAAEQIGAAKIAPVIMLTAFSQKELVERAREAGVMAYIVKPFTQADLGPAVDIARSRWEERLSLESEIADLGERLATRKSVDRAKGILMTQLKITEGEAFRWIQKTAMDRRLGMREVADAVIEGMSGNK